ncbi:Shikimate kinase [Trichinella spiralis]|uniref:Shikimate kinase n=1 Tax=Trichinella spiralis TaxID=6334 RepID=A0ABR3L1N5_TRISP
MKMRHRPRSVRQGDTRSCCLKKHPSIRQAFNLIFCRLAKCDKNSNDDYCLDKDAQTGGHRAEQTTVAATVPSFWLFSHLFCSFFMPWAQGRARVAQYKLSAINLPPIATVRKSSANHAPLSRSDRTFVSSVIGQFFSSSFTFACWLLSVVLYLGFLLLFATDGNEPHRNTAATTSLFVSVRSFQASSLFFSFANNFHGRFATSPLTSNGYAEASDRLPDLQLAAELHLSHRNSTVSVSNGSPLNVDLIGFNPNTVGHLLPASASGQQSIYSQAWCGDRWAPAGRPADLPACLPTAGHVTSLIVSLGNELQLAPTPASRCTLPFLFYTGDVFLVHFPSFVALCWSAEEKSTTTTTTSTTILSPLSNGQRP